MKVFKETKQPKKSWSITLEDSIDRVRLVAVDSQTGKEICTLLNFFPDGKIIAPRNAKFDLETKGYNPYEHGNSFDYFGTIKIITNRTF